MPWAKTEIPIVVIGHVDPADKPVSTSPVINKCQGDKVESMPPGF